MRLRPAVLLFFLALSTPALSAPPLAEWQASTVPASGRVSEIDLRDGDVRIAIGAGWYQFDAGTMRLLPAAAFKRPAAPTKALADGRVATGRDTVARAWLAEPTERYRHGVLGDAIEAGSLVIERREGGRRTLRLDGDAVFEDLEPRVAAIGGRERIVLVKSYLKRGSALAVIDPASTAIIAETPPIGRAHAWLNPAGIADFNGDGTTDIVLVRQPHVVGMLEMWSWQHDRLEKSAEISDVSNHFIGSRSLHMSFTADFDGDGHPDLAVPDLERRTLRLIGFVPGPRDIARIRLPTRIATNIGGIKYRDRPALVFGLEDGRLMLVHD
ncbi:FG-GAP repeat domain-containing protein [Bradyrhizobium sp. 1.29L]